MLNTIVSQIALQIFKGALETGDREQAMLAWELMHLGSVLGEVAYKPNPDDPDPWPWPWYRDVIGPQPDPWRAISPVIQSELVKVGAGFAEDSILRDKRLSHSAAKSMSKKLRKALDSFDGQTAAAS